MEQRERIGDYQEGIRSAIEGFLVNVWTALPGIVQSFDPGKMTLVVQPAIRAAVRDSKGKQTWVELPLLLDVPVVFPAGGGFCLTLPIQQGDEVLVVFASRCMDAWWQSGGIQNQIEFRLHDLSDGFAIPGPRSVPNAFSGISTNTAQLRNLDGSAYIELAAGGVVNIVAPGGVNINGATAITGDVAVTGKIDATKEITAKGTHTVSAHIHGGVQSGGSNTAPPTG